MAHNADPHPQSTFSHIHFGISLCLFMILYNLGRKRVSLMYTQLLYDNLGTLTLLEWKGV